MKWMKKKPGEERNRNQSQEKTQNSRSVKL